jgi:hypothetical protein
VDLHTPIVIMDKYMSILMKDSVEENFADIIEVLYDRKFKLCSDNIDKCLDKLIGIKDSM